MHRMNVSLEKLAENYHNVLKRIHHAAEQAGRDPMDVKLVAVTKYVDDSVVRSLYQLGCRNFGENRPQVLWEKADKLSDCDISWHMIGHLQTNKVKRSLPMIYLLHAGDSLKLLNAVNREANAKGVVADVLCEVNISGDGSKHGFSPDSMADSLTDISQMQNVRVKGLMAMASLTGGTERAGEDFQKLRRLRDQLQQVVPDNVSLSELSMGMSGDFEQAIDHGATLVRVGSVLYQ